MDGADLLGANIAHALQTMGLEVYDNHTRQYWSKPRIAAFMANTLRAPLADELSVRPSDTGLPLDQPHDDPRHQRGAF